MALENSGTPNPDSQSGAGNGNSQQQPTDGNRADTNREGQQQNQGDNKKVFTYQEDRTDWTPRHRLNEESSKRQTAEQKLAAAQAELEAERKRTRALAGLYPPALRAASNAFLKSSLLSRLPTG